MYLLCVPITGLLGRVRAGIAKRSIDGAKGQDTALGKHELVIIILHLDRGRGGGFHQPHPHSIAIVNSIN